MKKIRFVFCVASSLFLFGTACSSPQTVKSQAYASLGSQRTFEMEMPEVWTAVEKSLEGSNILENKKEDSVQRQLKTDWTEELSRDKYYTYKVNGLPKKKYLQVRFKYLITAKKVMGGTDVKIDTTEEIQSLKKDGTPDGFTAVKKADPSRAAELLNKIDLVILSSDRRG